MDCRYIVASSAFLYLEPTVVCYANFCRYVFKHLVSILITVCILIFKYDYENMSGSWIELSLSGCS